jgi:hypothetical protein
MKTFRELTEASVHPMAVHAYPSGKNQFTVHAVGSKVNHVSVGDKLSSSDLDDLTDAGHKVKEVKKPVSEEVEQVDEISKKAVNAYLDRSDEISDADRPGDKAKKPNRERGNKLAYDKLTGDAKIGATLGNGKTRIGPGGKAIKNEEVEQVNELSKDTMKSYVKKALDTNTSLNANDDKSIINLASRSGREMGEVGRKLDHKAVIRSQGVQRAVNKLTKEEVEQVDESGLSTKTLANYSIKASAATTDKSLPAKKTNNRYAGVHKVDKILSLRDKKKVD